MKVLLVYPEYPDTFWSFRHALKIAGKRASFPPLGLLTVAAMLPQDWDKRLVDMNTSRLSDRDIKWADYVLISAMVVQRNSALDVIKRCRALGTKIVAGGPLFTTEYEIFEGVDHFVLDEAENTLPPFLADLETGKAGTLYRSDERPDISRTPVPMWSLVKMGNYTSMSLQYSRGCPYDCEFCDIVVLNGHRPRTKSTEQFMRELDSVYETGWRDGVLIVDDNFIGNKRKIKADLLPAIIEWQKQRRYPFLFFTEASINLADDEELLRLMVAAGFESVFVGIESPNEESLAECHKNQNRRRNLVQSIQRIQRAGLQVQGGFILGFDSDPDSIFDAQIDFIQRSGIVTAMVSLLNAPPHTRLYHRLKDEGRLMEGFTGDNMDSLMNFVPRMDKESLLSGYKKILNTIYRPQQYYARIKTFSENYSHKRKRGISSLRYWHVRAFLRSIWFLGFADQDRWQFWRFYVSTLLKRPHAFPLSISFAIYGYHFRTVVRQYTGAASLPGKKESGAKTPRLLTTR